MLQSTGASARINRSEPSDSRSSVPRIRPRRLPTAAITHDTGSGTVRDGGSTPAASAAIRTTSVLGIIFSDTR